MSARISWDDFWPMVLAMPPETQMALAEAFEFDDWLISKSPAVVFEVVRGMPPQAAARYLGLLTPPLQTKLVKHYGLPSLPTHRAIAPISRA